MKARLKAAVGAAQGRRVIEIQGDQSHPLVCLAFRGRRFQVKRAGVE